MEAAILEEFGSKLSVKEQPTPEPGEGELLVKIKASGINPVDAKLAHGYMKDRLPHEFPMILGWDMAGIVEKRGHGARRFSVGDEVYAYARRPELNNHGTFADYITIPESYLAKKPINISFEEAGAIPLAGLTAYQSILEVGKLKLGDTVMILGASGGVGSFAVQLAKYEGAQVIAVASKDNHAYLKELGADHCLDYKDQKIEEVIWDIAPEGVDLVFDAVGGDTTLQGARCLKEGGRLVSITHKGDGLPDHIDFHYVFTEPNSRQLDHIREMVEAGTLKVKITKAYRLDDINDALEQIETGHTTGKIIVKM
ncbi:NADP-dependent oxidoreductase [Fulvivirga sp. 29W222]|uniref:NADP-dependent oxidoreductase n=1 Tax=Fulvivirga marina TaxID=2494733 RepID=A0A937G2P0_9BACT|nr:NADP-dependent oxidoreductase [Fulvivirga marina]MBL6449136.1 NADP-dependent oxidoreductase [Fulvivirga marina]